jgi:2,3-bisphosphoglycerate-independent phosphoglycerate mutase
LPNASGRSELEQANIPQLDRLAQESLCGLTMPVAYGVTPGSGPGHLALFGYDPEKYTVGRGVLEALGVDFDLQSTDVAARGNFCTVDAEGRITDRRAGRIATEYSAPLCEKLSRIKLPGVQTFVEPVRDHRFLLVLRGEGLSDRVSETDPSARVSSRCPHARPAEVTAGLLNQWIAEAEELHGHEPANMLTLRGITSTRRCFDCRNMVPRGNHGGVPMYRGLAKLVGMDVLRPGDVADEVRH